MSIKRTICALLIAVAVGASTTATPAQSVGRKAWRERAVVADLAPAAPAAATQTAAKGTKKAIVGSWLGISGEGNRLLVTFHSDGTVHSSVQTEVSTNPELGVLTPGHGVWKHAGGRQFEYTVVGLLYTIDTGEYIGSIKARGAVTLDAAGNQLSGTDRVDIFGPDGGLVFAVPPGPTQFTRVEHEPFD